MDSILQDLRYAIRGIRRSRGVMCVTVATLAIGIAAVTTIFSFVDSALFRPLPYPGADRIVALSEESTHGYTAFSSIALETVRAIRGGTSAFQRVAAFRAREATVTDGDEPARVVATEVDTDLLPMLAIRPERGRLPTAAEIRAKAAVVLVSDRLWRARLATRDDIIGSTVRVFGAPYTVIGVMPDGFRFSERSDLWVPLGALPGDVGSGVERTYSALAQLRQGVTREQARRDVRVVSQRLAASDPQDYVGWSLAVRDEMIDRNPRAWRPFAVLFLGAAICVLLVACSNVATLMLARSVDRRAEMAVRASLGASRQRLIRQNLTESVLVGLVAGAAGALLSVWGVRLMTGLVPIQSFPSWLQFGVDVRVLFFTFGISLIAVGAFGLLPALEGTRIDLATALKSGGDRAVTSQSGRRRGRVVVVAELASAVVLFVAVALLARSYRNVTTIDPGFDAYHVLAVTPVLDPAQYPDAERRSRYVEALGARLSAHPGVAAVASRGYYGGSIAPSSAHSSDSTQAAAGDSHIYLGNDVTTPADRGLWPFPQVHVVSDDYFRTLALPLLRGRPFRATDVAGSAPVVIVSDRLARHLWKAADPIGRTLRVGKAGPELTVVGVAHDVREVRFSARGLRADPLPDLYLSNRQAIQNNIDLLVRATGNPVSLESAVLDAARRVDRDQVISRMETLAGDALAGGALMLRPLGIAMSVFAIAGLALALIGIFGVIAHNVARRTNEIGIRMALGAAQPDIVRLVMRDGTRLIAMGLMIGLLAAAALSRAMRLVVFGVSPLDAVTYSSVAMLFTAVALAACYIPARRATRVEPGLALKRE